jgi:hypothetical protein
VLVGQLALGVPAQEPDPVAFCEQPLERRARERAPEGVPSADDGVHTRRVHVCEDGLERGQVSVDVVQRRDPHASGIIADRRGRAA